MAALIFVFAAGWFVGVASESAMWRHYIKKDGDCGLCPRKKDIRP